MIICSEIYLRSKLQFFSPISLISVTESFISSTITSPFCTPKSVYRIYTVHILWTGRPCEFLCSSSQRQYRSSRSNDTPIFSVNNRLPFLLLLPSKACALQQMLFRSNSVRAYRSRPQFQKVAQLGFTRYVLARYYDKTGSSAPSFPPERIKGIGQRYTIDVLVFS